MTIHDRFEKHIDQHCKFELVEHKRSNCADIHAFMLLNDIFEIDYNIITSVDHYGYYLGISDNELEILTDKQIIELIRCGITHCTHIGCLYNSI